MEMYLAGTDVTAVIPLQDRNGNALNVTALEYDVVDQNDAVVVERAALPGFVPGAGEATVIVPASANALSGTNWREVRRIRLYCSVGANAVELRFSFGVSLADALLVGTNTFQGLDQAELTALDIPNLDAWDAATDDEKQAALIDARGRICALSFRLLNSNIDFGQESLNYVPEGSYKTRHAGLFMFDGNLAILDAEQYKQLPERFKEALRKAQVTEADNILGNDVIGQKRDAGIVQDAVGESRQTFRDAKPLDLPICKRALRFLAAFIQFNRRIGR